MNQLKHNGLLCSCLILAACANDRPVGVVQPSFGNAVQQNIAGETVNPAAPVDRAPLTMNGERAALQQLRYLTDMVEKPANIGTQTTGAGGGGGGGGAGGGTGTGGGASTGTGAAVAAP